MLVPPQGGSLAVHSPLWGPRPCGTSSPWPQTEAAITHCWDEWQDCVGQGGAVSSPPPLEGPGSGLGTHPIVPGAGRVGGHPYSQLTVPQHTGCPSTGGTLILDLQTQQRWHCVGWGPVIGWGGRPIKSGDWHPCPQPDYSTSVPGAAGQRVYPIFISTDLTLPPYQTKECRKGPPQVKLPQLPTAVPSCYCSFLLISPTMPPTTQFPPYNEQELLAWFWGQLVNGARVFSPHLRFNKQTMQELWR